MTSLYLSSSTTTSSGPWHTYQHFSTESTKRAKKKKRRRNRKVKDEILFTHLFNFHFTSFARFDTTRPYNNTLRYFAAVLQQQNAMPRYKLRLAQYMLVHMTRKEFYLFCAAFCTYSGCRFQNSLLFTHTHRQGQAYSTHEHAHICKQKIEKVNPTK